MQEGEAPARLSQGNAIDGLDFLLDGFHLTDDCRRVDGHGMVFVWGGVAHIPCIPVAMQDLLRLSIC